MKGKSSGGGRVQEGKKRKEEIAKVGRDQASRKKRHKGYRTTS